MQEQEQAQLIEMKLTHDTFISGVGNVQIMGHNARITLYAEQEGGVRLVVAKIIVPIEAIPACIGAVIKATWSRLTLAPFLEVAVADRIGRH